MKRMLWLLIIYLATYSVAPAAQAAPVRMARPESQIVVKAKDLILKQEKSYHCVLEGAPEDKWSWQDSLELNVTAASLQDAAELALTPYVTVPPQNGSDVVKIKVDGQGFLVRHVNCKLVQRSI